MISETTTLKILTMRSDTPQLKWLDIRETLVIMINMWLIYDTSKMVVKADQMESAEDRIQS